MKKKTESCRSVKIEGEAFERIKVKVEASKELIKSLREAKETSHTELWDLIHQEFPQFERDANLTLDSEYGELGSYVLKEKDGDGPSGLLAALKASLA